MQKEAMTSAHLSDISADTLRALRDGQEWAYNEVYCRHASSLKDFLAKLIRNEQDAEELNHDIFLTLWMNREKIQPEKGISGFLYLRAKQLALNWFAHKKVRQKYEDFCANADFEYDLPSDAGVIARETQVLTQIALQGMSERKQTIWRLRMEQGLSPDDIANRLEISPSTVNNNLTDIKKALREVIAMSVLIFFP